MTTAIVDFGNLFHRLWHMSNGEPVDNTRAKVRDFVLKLRTGGEYDDVIIAIDAPPYQRRIDYPDYKANRAKAEDDLKLTMYEAVKDLAADGVRVARCQGWEADDVIATLVNQLDNTVVYGTDKDLLQSTPLTVPFTNEIKTAEITLGVKQDLVVDYLALVGDSSDNIPGVAGVGAKTAVAMLDKYGSLTEIRRAIRDVKDDPEQKDFRPKTVENFLAAEPFFDKAINLIVLRDDLDIEYVKAEPRPETVDVEPIEQTPAPVAPRTIEIAPAEPQHIVRHQETSYRHSIEPFGVEQSYKAAVMLHKSGLWIKKFANPESILATIMRGRAMGLSTIQSLDLIHFIQGQPVMSAQGLISTVKASPLCKYFMCTELSAESCTWETLRVGDPCKSTRTFTRAQADKAGFSRTKYGVKDNWDKQPDIMLQWRCGSSLARQVYPDVTNGVYSEEEMS